MGNIENFDIIVKYKLIEQEPNYYTTFCLCLSTHIWIKKLQAGFQVKSFFDLFKTNIKLSIFSNFVQPRFNKLQNLITKPLSIDDFYVTVEDY